MAESFRGLAYLLSACWLSRRGRATQPEMTVVVTQWVFVCGLMLGFSALW
jgi:hypothetical protein